MTNAEARFNKIHIREVYACLAVTCHLLFWQNDRDFLRATVVTRGWNGYRNKSQHRKSTLEKKILPPFQQGFEPATFQSRVRCSNHWAIPAPLSQESAHQKECYSTFSSQYILVSLLRKFQASNVQELMFYSTLKIGVFVQNVTLRFYLFWAYFRKHLCQNALLYSF